MARRRIHPLQSEGADEERGVSDIHIPLDRERIIQAVLYLLREEGLGSISMRKIADSLGVKAASLYYHVKDKEQLMHLLADQISSDVSFPDESLYWQEQLREWALDFRLALHRYRDAISIMSATMAGSPKRLAHIEFLYRLFAQSGFSDPHIPWFASMIKNYIYSFVDEENRLMARAAPVEPSDKNEETPAARMQSLSAEQYPHFVRLLPFTTAVNWDEEFLFGLKVLIDGFEAQRK
ncbi:TetR family transcriptional regulator [Paenibacillus sp. Soil766]|uniref:TetR/AcrR family transcriptional regulator C-terminal domain-containing protein n=1 Tax=Paenibacillus sp. Soil766 TaxID=1736404 RepID=UPI00070F1728|nr:TetR/AcrR family transcriptional regulator C-terminal domain-containing protein [Paenibacillus sp. Soil766]KRF03770.1 TetR family transcriptional regulator [Paenibacillus sp. Soil766]